MQLTLRRLIVILLWAFLICPTKAEPLEPTLKPLVRVMDLDIGEGQDVELCNGEKVHIKLLGLQEERDSVCNAVRATVVKVEVNGQRVSLVSATYHLPTTVGGVQIDCAVTKGYLTDSNRDHWGLLKDARLRLWPARSPLIASDTFSYPVKQRWFASDTQMANEPVFVDGGDKPGSRKIYYHTGLDFGGAEGLVEVVSATDGLVVSAGKEKLEGYEDAPVEIRYDVVYILDGRGWYYRYSHLSSIDAAIRPGQQIKRGQKIGLIGKEGASGGWSHLHFEIKSRQPSGKWGTQAGYAFVWEAYQKQYKPEIIAVVRPHSLAWTGEKVLLDATMSWSKTSKIKKYEWNFTDGSKTTGEQIERVYNKPGTYSEIVKVTDAVGKTDYDFAVVQIVDKDKPKQLPPTINAAYYPTFGIKAGDEVTFKVRTFRTTHGQEEWDFGDGSDNVTVQSDGNANVHNPNGYAVTCHCYQKPGDYIVIVRRSNEYGHTATAHLHVQVGLKSEKETNSYLKAKQQDMQWWQDSKFGMFIHWGPVSLKGTEIGWSRGGERRGRKDRGSLIPVDVYDNLYKQFNPVKFDADEWVSIAQEAGMKYLVFTSKHHDGFCMFDSKLTEYKITNSPFGRDVVKELADACHRAGLKFGIYYSPPDWHHPDYRTERHENYIKYMHGQLRELCSNYGRVDIVWFDGLGGTTEDWDSENLFKMIRSLQPHLIINNRAGLSGDYDTPEQRIGKFQNDRPWETCMTICKQWAWKPDDKMKTLKECIQTLVRCVGGDGNLLLNVGPMPDGRIEPRQVERLKEMGQWLGKCGETIYATRGGPFKPGSWGASTYKDDVIYLHLMNADKKPIILPTIDKKILASKLLTGEKVTAIQYEKGIAFNLPDSCCQEIDNIVKILLDGPASEIVPREVLAD